MPETMLIDPLLFWLVGSAVLATVAVAACLTSSFLAKRFTARLPAKSPLAQFHDAAGGVAVIILPIPSGIFLLGTLEACGLPEWVSVPIALALLLAIMVPLFIAHWRAFRTT